jgi:hypothetical protein
MDVAFSSAKLAGLSFPITITRSSKETESLTKFAINSAAAMGEDKTVSVAGADPAKDAGASYSSLACTYIPLGDSDLVYVQKNAMRRAS